jgi:hypothetical protein
MHLPISVNYSKGQRILIACILFYSGLVFCLPVTPSEEMALAVTYPWWATRIEVGSILLNELLFIFWLALFGGRFVLRALLNNVGIPTRQAAICLIVLALWCGLISIMSLNASSLAQDVGRTFRLIILGLMVMAVVEWTVKMGNYTLFILLLGIFTGTVINLIISFQNPFMVLGSMRLHGQNTPGVWMGVAIHLAVWLFFHSTSRKAQGFSVVMLLVFSLGVGLSFSRIGWIVATAGYIAWIYILFFAKGSGAFGRNHMKRIRRLLVPILLIVSVIGFSSSNVQNQFQTIQNLIQQKAWNDSNSNTERYTYFIATAEILVKHPFGVGYSGFYDAMMETDIYKGGKAANEESRKQANPHATFLWYAVTGGIFGGVLAIVLFLLFLRIMKIGLFRAFGQTGTVFFYLIAGSMFIIGLTVPYLFNSPILILPTAIAAGLGLSKRFERSASSFKA